MKELGGRITWILGFCRISAFSANILCCSLTEYIQSIGARRAHPFVHHFRMQFSGVVLRTELDRKAAIWKYVQYCVGGRHSVIIYISSPPAESYCTKY